MPTIASHQFADISLPSGGVILKSSDGVEFKVYKNILALASPFFHQMFTLPQPVNTDSRGASQNSTISMAHDVQTIDVSESSSTLDILLRLIYPIVPPIFPGTSESGEVVDGKALVYGIEPILAAALKYDMHLIVKPLCSRLLDAAESTLPDGRVIDNTLALRIFVLACRHRLKEEARRSAHAALKGRITGVFITELRQISAAQYFHLMQFHQKIIALVDPILKTSDRPELTDFNFACASCSSNRYSGGFRPASWWEDFVTRARPILLQSPKSGTVFSSEFLKDTFRKASNCGSSDCRQLPGRWQTIAQEIKEKIDHAIVENDIDLSEI